MVSGDQHAPLSLFEQRPAQIQVANNWSAHAELLSQRIAAWSEVRQQLVERSGTRAEPFHSRNGADFEVLNGKKMVVFRTVLKYNTTTHKSYTTLCMGCSKAHGFITEGKWKQ